MTLIGICGGTGSGKSTLANKIESHFKSSGVVKIRSDSYYKNHSTLTFNDRSKINYDHPSSIDFELLINNLKNLKNNKKIIEPIYSYKTHKRLKKSKIIFSKKIIIVEGLHIFCDKRIINLIDYSIYLDLDEKTRLHRRINRDVEFRGRSIDEVEQKYFKFNFKKNNMLSFLKKICSNRYFNFFTNLYILTSLVFLFWMLFVDTNSFLFHKELNVEINDLKEQKKKLKIEIEKDKKFIEDLNNIDKYEAYAREKFFMKKDNEEIYIIEFKDSLKN